jgi:chromosome segregation ATPase
MWDEAKQQQLNDLRRQAESGAITSAGEQRLAVLLDELDREEWDQLRPALAALDAKEQQLRTAFTQLQSEREALVGLAQRYEDWLARARRQFAELLNEREELRAEYERVAR